MGVGEYALAISRLPKLSIANLSFPFPIPHLLLNRCFQSRRGIR
jgi:hypothetical protein